MSENRLRLVVIVGSVREGRFGLPLSRWFAGRARRLGRFEVDVLDLAEHSLPMAMPGFGDRPDTATADVQAEVGRRLAAADAFVLVTPEYNHSYPAALKNVLDWFRSEWVAKAFGLVSYGGQGGGVRAAEHLRQVVAELHSVTVRDAMSFHNAFDLFDEREEIADEGECAAAATRMLTQLEWWATVLREGRERHAYPG
ncbi:MULTISPECIES: NADPH-dependent FMN reductase [unclassified Streptomyces]|uniref:NADPH-dependent FMN reductase n=1 Tax=unclassified Streptomyces TaxID=2593676 RepID=UPI0019086FE1|nr:NAD(P)H-dependent oxidoreductase [Streptomyces sp. HSG2]